MRHSDGESGFESVASEPVAGLVLGAGRWHSFEQRKAVGTQLVPYGLSS